MVRKGHGCRNRVSQSINIVLSVRSLTYVLPSTSFDEHVIGGYKFLMRHYSPGDDIILFGFSRGAYTARFLAEMLDHVGLVSQGNEEMIMFAWKTFSNWQQRRENGGQQKEEMYKYVFFYPPFHCRIEPGLQRAVRGGGEEPMGDRSNQIGLECGMAVSNVGEQYGHELIISSGSLGFSRLL